jgi:hypothetical protein
VHLLDYEYVLGRESNTPMSLQPVWDWIEDNVFRSITIRGEQEYPKQVTLTITERGWHDDAVEGVVMRYRLQKSSDGWRVTGAEGKRLMRPGY